MKGICEGIAPKKPEGMTQTPEMPNSVYLSAQFGGTVGFETFPSSVEYIRRAVSKEEAVELSEYLDCGVSCPPKIYNIIRKMAEAHK